MPPQDAYNKPQVVNEFNGGLVTKLNPERLQPNQSPDLLNADFVKRYSVRKRTSFTELGDDSGTDPVAALFSHRVRRVSQYLLKVVGTDIKIWNPENTDWYDITGALTLTDGLKWDSNTFEDDLFMGNGVDDFMAWNGAVSQLDGSLSGGEGTVSIDDASLFNTSAPSGSTHGMKAIIVNKTTGVATVISYTGVSGNDLTGVTGAPAAPDESYIYQHIETYAANPKGNIYNIFGGRLVISGTSSNPALVYFSKGTDRRNFTVAGGGATDDAGFLSFPGSVTTNQSLFDTAGEPAQMVACDDFNWYQFEIDDPTTGTIAFFKPARTGVASANNAAIPVENDIMFADFDNNIRTLGFKEQFVDVRTDIMSDAIEPTVQDDLEFDDMASAYNKRNLYISCRETGSTINDVLLLYRVEYRAWSLWRGIGASSFATLANVLHFGSSANSKVYFFDDTQLSDADDTPIDFRYSIGDLDFGLPLQYKTMRRMRIGGLITENCNLTIKVFYDKSATPAQQFVISGSNTAIIGSILPAGAYGIIIYGGETYGGSANSLVKTFIAQIEYGTLQHFEQIRITIENSEADVDFEVSRLAFMLQADHILRFPKNKIIKPS